MDDKKYIPYVIKGSYSKEFLESMGYKSFIPDVYLTPVKNPIMPLETVKLAYELKIKENND